MSERFRADPQKVRVSVRPVGSRWRCEVRPRTRFHFAVAISKWPLLATMRALRIAQRAGFDGMDLHLQWAYRHPMYPEGE